jgi:hypothetical protein
MNDQEFVARQQAFYSQLGTALFEMLDPKYRDQWKEIALHVERIGEGVPFRFTYKVTLTLEDGLALPLIARPTVIAITDSLDRLCQERSGKAWNQLDYRLYQEADGPAFECRFGYPQPVH